MIKLSFLILASACQISNQHLHATPVGVSGRIEGVADFLLERSNDTIISMFEKKINKNPLVKKYFPNTSKILITFNLKLLMLNEGLWKDNVEKDLTNFTEDLKSQIKEDVGKTFNSEKYSELTEVIKKLKKKRP